MEWVRAISGVLCGAVVCVATVAAWQPRGITNTPGDDPLQGVACLLLVVLPVTGIMLARSGLRSRDVRVRRLGKVAVALNCVPFATVILVIIGTALWRGMR